MFQDPPPKLREIRFHGMKFDHFYIRRGLSPGSALPNLTHLSLKNFELGQSWISQDHNYTPLRYFDTIQHLTLHSFHLERFLDFLNTSKTPVQQMRTLDLAYDFPLIGSFFSNVPWSGHAEFETLAKTMERFDALESFTLFSWSPLPSFQEGHEDPKSN
jgi:hypothetical protein